MNQLMMPDFSSQVANTQNSMLQAGQYKQEKAAQQDFQNALAAGYGGKAPQNMGQYTPEQQQAFRQALSGFNEAQTAEAVRRYNTISTGISQLNEQNYPAIAQQLSQQLGVDAPASYQEYKQIEPQLKAQLAMMGAELGVQAPSPVSVASGASLVNPQTGQPIYTNVKPEEDTRTNDIKTIEQAAAMLNYQKGTPEYTQFVQEQMKGGPLVNVTNGGGSEFYDTLDGQAAQTFAALMDNGLAASQTGIKLQQLETLLSGVDTGAGAQWKMMAGNLGINTEGLGDIQAAQALINQMVPAQRPVGSGPMSDADLELFKQSMPRIVNQEGGNALILDTMKSINAYTIKQSEIANQVANRELTPAQGRQALMRLDNPLSDFSAQAARYKSTGQSTTATEGQTATDASGATYKNVGGKWINTQTGEEYTGG